MSDRVAFLGLGAMGQRMAANLLQASHELHVWNRTPARCTPLVKQGTAAHATPREAAQQAEVVIAMVRDDEASRAVWLDDRDGALSGMFPGAVAIECSTLSLDCCSRLANRMAAQQVGFLDAPVVGSRPQAEARQLIHLVGGEEAVLDQARDVLGAGAAAIHRVGGQGAGMAMKLAVNTLFGIQVAALGELLGLLASRGINAPAAADLLGQLPVTSPAAKGAAAAIAAGNFAPLFPIDLVHKDLGYALDAAAPGNRLPTTAGVQALFAEAIERGHGANNIHAIAKLFNPNS